MWVSPNSDFFQPPKLNEPTGTGIGTLTPTMPTSMANSNSRALLPSRVKIATPLANWFALMSSTASSNVSTRTTDSTGPKISSS